MTLSDLDELIATDGFTVEVEAEALEDVVVEVSEDFLAALVASLELFLVFVVLTLEVALVVLLLISSDLAFFSFSSLGVSLLLISANISR